MNPNCSKSYIYITDSKTISEFKAELVYNEFSDGRLKSDWTQ